MSGKKKKAKKQNRHKRQRRTTASADPHAIAASVPEYYQAPFYSLVAELHEQIASEYLHVPATLRRDYFASHQLLGQTLRGQPGFEHFKRLTQDIEQRIASKLRTHSVFFWLHLYRRLGVTLPSDVESNSDPNTLALVRLIVEAAIQKYGRLDIDSDVRLKGDVQISSILGGLFEERWSQILGKDRFQSYRPCSPQTSG